MGVDVSLTGVSEILDYVQYMGIDVSNASDEALNAAAEPVLQDMKETTAFIDRSGKLRKSIKKSAVKIDKYRGKYIRIGSTAPNAHLVELGHGGPEPAPAHPFVQPAYEKNKANIEKIIREKLMEALK